MTTYVVVLVHHWRGKIQGLHMRRSTKARHYPQVTLQSAHLPHSQQRHIVRLTIPHRIHQLDTLPRMLHHLRIRRRRRARTVDVCFEAGFEENAELDGEFFVALHVGGVLAVDNTVVTGERTDLGGSCLNLVPSQP